MLNSKPSHTNITHWVCSKIIVKLLRSFVISVIDIYKSSRSMWYHNKTYLHRLPIKYLELCGSGGEPSTRLPPVIHAVTMPRTPGLACQIKPVELWCVNVANANNINWTYVRWNDVLTTTIRQRWTEIQIATDGSYDDTIMDDIVSPDENKQACNICAATMCATTSNITDPWTKHHVALHFHSLDVLTK